MNPGPSHSASSETSAAEPSPPDVEAIMGQVRRAADQAAGQVEDYAKAASKQDAELSIGIDDQALVERVMQRVRALPPREPQTGPGAAPPADLPDPVARQLGFDSEREHGPIHRLLGKARRWLFRASKIQAEFEKMYERINADLMNLERRTGAGVVELQQWIERRLADSGGHSVTTMSLCDPLALSPEQRWRVGAEELARRAEDYVPFVREAAVRARESGRRDVLDLGCGEGVLLEALGQANLDAEGIDPNPLRVGRCRERQVRAVETSLREFLLHCPEGEYRCVTALHVLEYVAEAEMATLVGEFKRVLAPGGRLLVEVPRVPDAPPQMVSSERIRSACQTAGFTGVFTHGLHPSDPSEAFPPVDSSLPGAGQINALVEKLNARFCGARDTLIVAEV